MAPGSPKAWPGASARARTRRHRASGLTCTAMGAESSCAAEHVPRPLFARGSRGPGGRARWASPPRARDHGAMVLGRHPRRRERHPRPRPPVGTRRWRGRRRHASRTAGELDALAHRELGRRSQIQQLICADTQGVAHIGRECARIVETRPSASSRQPVQPSRRTRASGANAASRGSRPWRRRSAATSRGIATVLAGEAVTPAAQRAPRGKLRPTQCDPNVPTASRWPAAQDLHPSLACRRA